MKFIKKDGKVYNAVDAVHEHCENTDCLECKLYDRYSGCATWKYRNPEQTAILMGYEAIEDDTHDIREVVEENSEDAKPKRRTLGASNPTDDMTEYVEKYLEAVKPDPVNHPAHYTSGGIECIDAMQAVFGVEVVKDFCLCNAFKYLWRHRNKNGVEDLKKCRWYLNRLIAKMEADKDDG